MSELVYQTHSRFYCTCFVHNKLKTLEVHIEHILCGNLSHLLDWRRESWDSRNVSGKYGPIHITEKLWIIRFHHAIATLPTNCKYDFRSCLHHTRVISDDKKKFHGAGSTYTTLVHWPLTKGLKYQNQSFFTNLLVQSLQHLLMIIHKCIKLGKTQTMSENMNEICDSCKLTTDKLTKHQNYKTTEHQIFDAPNIFNCPRNAQTRRPHF
jgi:hypothetical protein